MFNLKNFYSVISHLKSISKVYEDKPSEFIILCPFCDDGTRKTNITHGHCYLGIDKPVFNCFRCGASGSLIKLLISTGFTDEECLKELGVYTKYVFGKDYFKKNKKIINEKVRNNILSMTMKFKNDDLKNYNFFKNYLVSRLGNINFTNFLIYPNILKINNYENLTCAFNNSENKLVTQRFIFNNKIRYKNNTDNSSYFFQKLNFDKVTDIVISEGAFDIINLYLYNNIFFSPRNSFYMAVCGKKYISNIERLLIQELLIGTYNIHIIFDSDFEEKKRFINKIKFLTSSYNSEISVFGWKPSFTKDTGDFPAIMEI